MKSKLLGEFIGTAFLLATVVGSGIMAERLSGDLTALALLCNTIPTGAILVVLITILGPVCGAHFNPAVTLAFFMRGEISGKASVFYVVVQIASGIFGTVLAHLMFGEAPLQLSETVRTGPAQWLAEVVATFGLVFCIFMAIRHRPDSVAWVVGLYITAAYWFTASTSFANPAVTIARSFTDTFSGILITHMPAFIAAQLAGAVLAVMTVRLLQTPQE